MNSLIHLGGAIAATWLALVFGYGTLDSNVIGLALLAVALLFLVLIWEGAREDYHNLFTDSGRGMLPTAWMALGMVLLVSWVFMEARPDYELGAVSFTDVSETVALVSSASPIAAGNYDSLDSPRGTDYQVPAGQTLYIAQLLGAPHTTAALDTTLSIGYGDTAVADSTSAPDALVIVFSTTYRAADGPPLPVEVFVPVPAGKYPFVLTDRAIAVQAVGVAR